MLNGASFVFLRDGVSLQVVKDAGVTAPVIEFVHPNRVTPLAPAP